MPAPVPGRRSPALLFGLYAVAMAGVACFDPLYEYGEKVAGAWSVCCVQGRVSTCECARGQGCVLPFDACAAGQCRTYGGVCGGGGGGGTQDAGLPWDAGSSEDAGANDGGPPPPPVYETCCASGWVTTCLCDHGLCPNTPFTACPNAACAPSGAPCP